MTIPRYCTEPDCPVEFNDSEIAFYCSICERWICEKHLDEIHKHCRGCATLHPAETVDPRDPRI